jgi:flagella basal body P-ring formation protein FlgA
MRFLFFLFLAACGSSALAADPSPIRKAIEEFVRLQTSNLPGKASHTIGAIDTSRLNSPCEGFDVSMGNGARPWGTVQVNVRCRGGNWSIWVPVKIRVAVDYLVTARALGYGQRLTEADIGSSAGELSELPHGVLTDKDQAIDRVVTTALPAGRPLRADQLKLPVAVQHGQNVKIFGIGNGFQVSSEGKSLANGSIGQVIQVRLNSGQIQSGVVRSEGQVEVRF